MIYVWCSDSYCWYSCTHFCDKVISQDVDLRSIRGHQILFVIYSSSLLIWCIDLFIDLRSQHSQRGHNYALIIVLDCACNTQGTIQADERCNDNGLCNCKSTVRGDKCTQCAPHYYGLDSLGDCYRRLLSYLYLQCLPLSHCLLLFYWFCCGLYLVFLLISVWLDM